MNEFKRIQTIYYFYELIISLGINISMSSKTKSIRNDDAKTENSRCTICNQGNWPSRKLHKSALG